MSYHVQMFLFSTLTQELYILPPRRAAATDSRLCVPAGGTCVIMYKPIYSPISPLIIYFHVLSCIDVFILLSTSNKTPTPNYPQQITPTISPLKGGNVMNSFIGGDPLIGVVGSGVYFHGLSDGVVVIILFISILQIVESFYIP